MGLALAGCARSRRAEHADAIGRVPVAQAFGNRRRRDNWCMLHWLARARRSSEWHHDAHLAETAEMSFATFFESFRGSSQLTAPGLHARSQMHNAKRTFQREVGLIHGGRGRQGVRRSGGVCGGAWRGRQGVTGAPGSNGRRTRRIQPQSAIRAIARGRRTASGDIRSFLHSGVCGPSPVHIGIPRAFERYVFVHSSTVARAGRASGHRVLSAWA